MKKIFVGTYTRDEGHVNGKAAGIYKIELDSMNQMVSVNTVAEVINPSFLALNAAQDLLFAVSETGPADGEEGNLYSYLVSEEGDLLPKDTIGTGGWAPCHVRVNKSGNMVLVSNYVGGVVSIYKNSTGQLKLQQTLSFEGQGSHSRQEAPHTHMTILSPDEQYLYVADLGVNVIWNFWWDAEKKEFVPNKRQEKLEMDAEAGPRHMEFHPNGKLLAVINELSNTVSLLSYEQESGIVSHIETQSTLPIESRTMPNTTADIHFHPSGKYLYGSNRGLNTLAVFSFDEKAGLQMIQQISTEGEIPRNFLISEDGSSLWVANQNSDNISIYAIDQRTGQLTFERKLENIMTPVCIQGI